MTAKKSHISGLLCKGFNMHVTPDTSLTSGETEKGTRCALCHILPLSVGPYLDRKVQYSSVL